MHFYGMGYREMLGLPISTFWELARNVDRIRAEEQKHQFYTINAVLSNPKDYLNKLEQAIGKIVEAEDEGGFNRAAFKQMKHLLGG